MQLASYLLTLIAANPSFAQTQKSAADVVMLTPAELIAIANAAQTSNQSSQEFELSLLTTLQKQGRVVTVESTQAMNCDGHATTIRAKSGNPDSSFLTVPGSLMEKLTKQGRVTTVESTQSMNCNEHGCDVRAAAHTTK